MWPQYHFHLHYLVWWTQQWVCDLFDVRELSEEHRLVTVLLQHYLNAFRSFLFLWDWLTDESGKSKTNGWREIGRQRKSGNTELAGGWVWGQLEEDEWIDRSLNTANKDRWGRGGAWREMSQLIAECCLNLSSISPVNRHTVYLWLYVYVFMMMLHTVVSTLMYWRSCMSCHLSYSISIRK